MRKIFILFIVIAIVVSCEREWKNPFDSLSNISRKDWTPADLEIQQTSLNSFQIHWKSVDKNIEGYKIDRKVNYGEWVTEYLQIPAAGSETMSITDSTILPDIFSTYEYRLYAYAGKNKSNEVTDSRKPEFPTISNITIEQISLSKIKIQWQDNTLGEDGFFIDKKLSASDWSRYDTLPENTTMYIDSRAAANDTNFYRIVAFQGKFTSRAVITNLNSIFAAPASLRIEKLQLDRVRLTWEDNSDMEKGYRIDRKLGTADWTVNYAEVGANSTEFIDNEMVPNRKIFYRVYAFSDGALSDQITADILIPFDAPGNFRTEQVNIRQIAINWQDNSDGEEGFKLFRIDGSGQWQLLATTTENKFTDNSPLYGWNKYKLYAYYKNFKTDSLEKNFSNVIARPGNLTTEVINSSTIKLAWDNYCPFSHSVSVERRPLGSEFSQIALLTDEANSFTDENVDSTVIYEYAVRGYIDPYYSQYSNIDTVRTIPPLPFEMVEVVAGDFKYGSGNETRHLDYTFQIMKYEVTNSQYAAYLQKAWDKNQITVTSTAVKGPFAGNINYANDDYLLYHLGDEDARITFSNDKFSVKSGYENHPVTEVTWFGAFAFARFYRCTLPTENEWEKSARGNSTRIYPWGDDFDSHYCNYHESGDPFDNGTTPAGLYNGGNNDGYKTRDNRSYYGAYDMAGNVWEWTSEWNDTNKHIVRGGSWYNSENFVHVYNRLPLNPELSYGYVGFRIVKK